jgi:very-short-patch-repair endonuclease
MQKKSRKIAKEMNGLKAKGFKVLRFWNNEVFTNIEGVLEVIRGHLLKSPSPIPSHRGGD